MIKLPQLSALVVSMSMIFTVVGCGGGGGGSSGGSGTAIELAWIPPATRADGVYLSLSNIAGYRVYVGSDPDNMSLTVDLADNSITEYAYLASGAQKYYFGVTAYDTSGRESGMSNIIYK